VIVTSGLSKRYGALLVVDGVSLDVREGDRYGFLGPNGSGKTTVVRMLLGLVYATSGTIEVLGRPVPRQISAVLPHIGALVESPGAYGHLSGRANLAVIDSAGHRPPGRRRDRRRRIGDALDRVGLGGIDDRPVRKYSLGMRQRLGLAAALLRSPRLLILDEPTNGLDPRGIHEIRTLLTELNAAGTTVFLSSHQLAEVDLLCTRIGVIDRGRLVLQDDLTALRGATGRVIVHCADADRAVTVLGGRVADRDGDRLVVADSDPARVNAQLTAAGLRVSEIAAERRSLEELVLSVTTGSSDRFDGADKSSGRQTAGDAGRDGDATRAPVAGAGRTGVTAGEPVAGAGAAAGESVAGAARTGAAAGERVAGAGESVAGAGRTAAAAAEPTAAAGEPVSGTGQAAAGAGETAAGR
jgi:ABC-type multidrug transport system ATPase subunit